LVWGEAFDFKYVLLLLLFRSAWDIGKMDGKGLHSSIKIMDNSVLYLGLMSLHIASPCFIATGRKKLTLCNLPVLPPTSTAAEQNFVPDADKNQG